MLSNMVVYFLVLLELLADVLQLVLHFLENLGQLLYLLLPYRLYS
jgi:hypothetical protein